MSNRKPWMVEVDRMFDNFLSELFWVKGVDYNEESEIAELSEYLSNFDIKDGFDEGLEEYYS